MREFSEDDFDTFDGWLKCQGFDAMTTPKQMALLRKAYDDARQRSLATPKMGRIFKPLQPGELRYAVAIRKAERLWLTLWVRRSPKGEYFVMAPRPDREWDPHTSYHLDGRLHAKSYGHKLITQKRQPLTSAFKGSEHLGEHAGHGTSVGAICDPSDFSGVVEVAPDVLRPWHGRVAIDLVEPGCEPTPLNHVRVVRQQIFRDNAPWVVIRICK